MPPQNELPKSRTKTDANFSSPETLRVRDSIMTAHGLVRPRLSLLRGANWELESTMTSVKRQNYVAQEQEHDLDHECQSPECESHETDE